MPIDFKNTLINLHKKFPEYDLDKLIEIIDAIVETTDYSKINYPPGNKFWWNKSDTSDPMLPPWKTISSIELKDDPKWKNITEMGILVKDPCKSSIIK